MSRRGSHEVDFVVQSTDTPIDQGEKEKVAQAKARQIFNT